MTRRSTEGAAVSEATATQWAVKPLEWEPDHGIAGLGPYRLFQAQTPLGRYVYGTDAEGNSYWHSSSSGVFMTGDEATAKRLAEAAWEKTARAEAGKFIVLPTLASSDHTPATERGGDEIAAQRLAASPLPSSSGTGAGEIECHGLDTPERVCFYEQDFYVLSNFSSFTLIWKDCHFYTSEHAYHWEKFPHLPMLQQGIDAAPSAHEAFKIAEARKDARRPDWDDVKVDIMRDILRAKATQHEYVRRKLLATGERELVENSWRDDFWGWGPNRDGKNMLGKLWMEIRAELRSTAPVSHGGNHGE